ncbi:MAG: AbrB/MazE/SpoVT family DNA-binding domain-containing protein [Vampirovibrionales bacterium]
MQKITSAGQVTLPKAVREELSIGQGDYVDFRIDGGRLILEVLEVTVKKKESREVQLV